MSWEALLHFRGRSSSFRPFRADACDALRDFVLFAPPWSRGWGEAGLVGEVEGEAVGDFVGSVWVEVALVGKPTIEDSWGGQLGTR